MIRDILQVLIALLLGLCFAVLVDIYSEIVDAPPQTKIIHYNLSNAVAEVYPDGYWRDK
jgi:hypothetical protein